jgi:hypothetical protein
MIPRSCTENAFVDWVHQLSVDYHHSCQPGDPRNTGNRFLSTGEVKEKIMYRTLSLFGKEYGAKLGGTAAAAAASGVSGARNGIKRDRKRKRQSKCLVVVDNAVQVKISVEFLTKLHIMWTHYMLKLLKDKGCDPLLENEANDATTTTLSKASRIIMECATTIEWVGARVRIVECKACPNWKDRQGVLVASTTNTWIVSHQIYNKSNTPTRLLQMTVPKRGSSLSIIFRVPQNQDDTTTTSVPWHAEIDSTTLQIHLRGND